MVDIPNEKRLAMERLNVFKQRYKDAPTDYLPLKIAEKWLSLFESGKIDSNQVKQIAETALRHRKEFDIAFFVFCNHIESVVRSLANCERRS